MNIDIFFILLFLITLRGIWPIRSGMSGGCSRSNRATGVSAVCYELTGPVCLKLGIIPAKCPQSSWYPEGGSPALPGLISFGFSLTLASVLLLLAMDCGTSRGGVRHPLRPGFLN